MTGGTSLRMKAASALLFLMLNNFPAAVIPLHTRGEVDGTFDRIDQELKRSLNKMDRVAHRLREKAKILASTRECRKSARRKLRASGFHQKKRGDNYQTHDSFSFEDNSTSTMQLATHDTAAHTPVDSQTKGKSTEARPESKNSKGGASVEDTSKGSKVSAKAKRSKSYTSPVAEKVMTGYSTFTKVAKGSAHHKRKVPDVSSQKNEKDGAAIRKVQARAKEKTKTKGDKSSGPTKGKGFTASIQSKAKGRKASDQAKAKSSTASEQAEAKSANANDQILDKSALSHRIEASGANAKAQTTCEGAKASAQSKGKGAKTSAQTRGKVATASARTEAKHVIAKAAKASAQTRGRVAEASARTEAKHVIAKAAKASAQTRGRVAEASARTEAKHVIAKAAKASAQTTAKVVKTSARTGAKHVIAKVAKAGAQTKGKVAKASARTEAKRVIAKVAKASAQAKDKVPKAGARTEAKHVIAKAAKASAQTRGKIAKASARAEAEIVVANAAAQAVQATRIARVDARIQRLSKQLQKLAERKLTMVSEFEKRVEDGLTAVITEKLNVESKLRMLQAFAQRYGGAAIPTLPPKLPASASTPAPGATKASQVRRSTMTKKYASSSSSSSALVASLVNGHGMLKARDVNLLDAEGKVRTAELEQRRCNALASDAAILRAAGKTAEAAILEVKAKNVCKKARNHKLRSEELVLNAFKRQSLSDRMARMAKKADKARDALRANIVQKANGSMSNSGRKHHGGTSNEPNKSRNVNTATGRKVEVAKKVKATKVKKAKKIKRRHGRRFR
eukprot:TRINITY_DN5564_c0_g1_i1.p1 TRINITY_DN5564_c0_g1~~TRINITY_DN5564_c0_g1_i1.p1  ORF type:complete len:814 (-),score=93.58 TRINITY_DN5564_c0_g1_i1:124-2508(-)